VPTVSLAAFSSLRASTQNLFSSSTRRVSFLQKGQPRRKCTLERSVTFHVRAAKDDDLERLLAEADRLLENQPGAERELKKLESSGVSTGELGPLAQMALARKLTMEGGAKTAESALKASEEEEVQVDDFVEYVSPYKGVGGKLQYVVGRVQSVDSKKDRVELQSFDKIMSLAGAGGLRGLYQVDDKVGSVFLAKDKVRKLDAVYNKAQQAWDITLLGDNLPEEQAFVEPSAESSVPRFWDGMLKDVDGPAALVGAALSAVFTFGMHQATLSLKSTFSELNSDFSNPTASDLSTTMRNFFESSAVLGTYTFFFVSVGLLALSISLFVKGKPQE